MTQGAKAVSVCPQLPAAESTPVGHMTRQQAAAVCIWQNAVFTASHGQHCEATLQESNRSYHMPECDPINRKQVPPLLNESACCDPACAHIERNGCSPCVYCLPSALQRVSSGATAVHSDTIDMWATSVRQSLCSLPHGVGAPRPWRCQLPHVGISLDSRRNVLMI
jgi:hypothetical protein